VTVPDVLDYLPIAAAAFAIPQFLPQILRLRATDDAAGVSWPWATLTSANNVAWIAYFALSGYWVALVPSSSAMLLAGALATMLFLRGGARLRPTVVIATWIALLIAVVGVAGRAGLGTLLTAAFALQVIPSIWTAYRTDRPTGISPGTWLLILGELSCWIVFGLHKSDPRLITLGITGVTASVFMLARVYYTRDASAQKSCAGGTLPGIHTQYVSSEEPLMSVPHALLALLSEKPKYGLRLQSEFEARTGEVWPLNVGQVYTTLQRLERDGLVEADGDGERLQKRKRYRITSAGTRELAEWLRTPHELVPPPRDELVIKVLVALQVPGIDVHELLQVHRRHVIEVMQGYTRIKAEAAEDDVALALVADAELFRLEAIVRWLDAADVRLRQLPTPAQPPVRETHDEPTRTMEVSQ
jgi:DNA-binding PadR family transcriptional regulator/uncharacterized protein with PQ loop repeat